MRNKVRTMATSLAVGPPTTRPAAIAAIAGQNPAPIEKYLARKHACRRVLPQPKLGPRGRGRTGDRRVDRLRAGQGGSSHAASWHARTCPCRARTADRSATFGPDAARWQRLRLD